MSVARQPFRTGLARDSHRFCKPTGAVVGWVEPPGPAFGRPDDKLRDTHQLQFAKVMGFAKGSTHPTNYGLRVQPLID